ncbi:MAG TPA: hypothetical protein PKI46_00095 [Bacteroidales bacterium]|nr:hypothetical protein [Bacteroidales bacterium]
MSINSMIERLKVKLLNFKVKYQDSPRMIIVHPASIIALKQVEFSLLVLGDILIFTSNRVDPDDFELY